MTRPEQEGPPLDISNLHQTVCNLLALETQGYWQINTAHLIGMTVLTGFLTQRPTETTADFYAILASALGILLSVSWFACIARSNAWHDLRVDQAVKIEADFSFPHKPVTEAKHSFRATKGWSIREAMYLLAVAFFIAFVVTFFGTLWKIR